MTNHFLCIQSNIYSSLGLRASYYTEEILGPKVTKLNFCKKIRTAMSLACIALIFKLLRFPWISIQVDVFTPKMGRNPNS